MVVPETTQSAPTATIQETELPSQTKSAITEPVAQPPVTSSATSVAPTETAVPELTLPPKETPTAREEPVLPNDPLLAQELAEQLTSFRWQHVTEQEQGFADEIITWTFFTDGTFRWQFASDYTLSYEGAWAVSPAAGGRGVLFLAGVTNGGGHFPRSDVLSLQFCDEGLALREAAYAPIALSNEDVPPETRKRDHDAVAAPEKDPHFSLWVAMTRNDWQSEAAPPPGEPDLYSFMRDGTYTGRFASGPCQYSGTWSLMGSGVNTGEIRLSIPANLCDSRGPRDASVREMPVTLSDGRLVLHRTAYLSASE
jgi:hypothetical protein